MIHPELPLWSTAGRGLEVTFCELSFPNSNTRALAHTQDAVSKPVRRSLFLPPTSLEARPQGFLLL